MQTAKLHALDQEIISLSDAVADRAALAREHAALFPARLALARLGSGPGLPHLHDAACAHAPLRAAWLAQAQRNFQAWLDNGGFTQHDEHAAVPAAAPVAVPAAEPAVGDPPAASTDTQQDNICID